METKLKDVIHLYLGCEAEITSQHATIRDYITFSTLRYTDDWIVKPILRQLSSIRLDEMAELKWNETDELKHAISQGTSANFYISEFLYLLKQGFDLFGLIDSGQAIDRNAVNDNN